MTLSYANSPDKLFGTIFMIYSSYMIKAADDIVNADLPASRLTHMGAGQNPLCFSLQKITKQGLLTAWLQCKVIR
jgi:hypothetical protein